MAFVTTTHIHVTGNADESGNQAALKNFTLTREFGVVGEF